MLTIKGTPDFIDAAYKTYKSAARELYQHCAGKAAQEKVLANTNLLANKKINNAFVYIVEGFCQLKHENKTIRLYSESDFIVTAKDFDDAWTLTSEFTTYVSFVEMEHFLAVIKDSSLTEQWTELLCLENKINVSLCSFYLQEDVVADFQYRQYSTGETIIMEGDTSREIFEMISGSAVVLRNNQEIGTINAGEPFGEISFLTASPRTATVKALESCFVRIADNEQFLKLITINPQLAFHISKTLAERVIQLNTRVVEKTI